MRVRIPATGLYTYPDIVIVCGDPEFEDEELDTLLNPTLIIEILSPSTEDYDRGHRGPPQRAATEGGHRGPPLQTNPLPDDRRQRWDTGMRMDP